MLIVSSILSLSSRVLIKILCIYSLSKILNITQDTLTYATHVSKQQHTLIKIFSCVGGGGDPDAPNIAFTTAIENRQNS